MCTVRWQLLGEEPEREGGDRHGRAAGVVSAVASIRH